GTTPAPVVLAVGFEPTWFTHPDLNRARLPGCATPAWCRRGDSNSHGCPPAPQAGASAIAPLLPGTGVGTRTLTSGFGDRQAIHYLTPIRRSTVPSWHRVLAGRLELPGPGV